MDSEGEVRKTAGGSTDDSRKKVEAQLRQVTWYTVVRAELGMYPRKTSRDVGKLK